MLTAIFHMFDCSKSRLSLKLVLIYFWVQLTLLLVLGLPTLVHMFAFGHKSAVDFVRRSLQRHSDTTQACEELTSEAIRRDTSDNVTVMIVSFHKRANFSWDGPNIDSERRPGTSESKLKHADNMLKSSSGKTARPKLQLSGISSLMQALKDSHNTHIN